MYTNSITITSVSIHSHRWEEYNFRFDIASVWNCSTNRFVGSIFVQIIYGLWTWRWINQNWSSNVWRDFRQLTMEAKLKQSYFWMQHGKLCQLSVSWILVIIVAQMICFTRNSNLWIIIIYVVLIKTSRESLLSNSECKLFSSLNQEIGLKRIFMTMTRYCWFYSLSNCIHLYFCVDLERSTPIKSVLSLFCSDSTMGYRNVYLICEFQVSFRFFFFLISSLMNHFK